MTVLQLNDTTFVSDRVSFRVETEYVNAWGWHCVSGTLLDMATMTVQRDALATCNMPASRREIVTAAFKEVRR